MVDWSVSCGVCGKRILDGERHYWLAMKHGVLQDEVEFDEMIEYADFGSYCLGCVHAAMFPGANGGVCVGCGARIGGGVEAHKLALCDSVASPEHRDVFLEHVLAMYCRECFSRENGAGRLAERALAVVSGKPCAKAMLANNPGPLKYIPF